MRSVCQRTSRSWRFLFRLRWALRARPGITARSCWLGYGGNPESYPSRLWSGSQIEAPGGAQSQFGYSRTGPKHPNQLAVREVTLDLLLGEVGQPEALPRGIQHKSGSVECELAVDA